MSRRVCFVLLLTLGSFILPQAAIPTCDRLPCRDGTVCRYVAPCLSCPVVPRCIPVAQVNAITDLDKRCQKSFLAEAYLLETKNSNKPYIEIKCSSRSSCPAGSVCASLGSRPGQCCTQELPQQIQKPGVCPNQASLDCGAPPCQTDTSCPGKQKCCPGCKGLVCADPVTNTGVLCDNIRCRPGQVCVPKQPPCGLDACIQIVRDTCVDAGCKKCAFNEDCKKTVEGYKCIPYA